MSHQKLKVLLIVDQCNPEAASVPLVGYNFFSGISKRADVTLVTHERNKTAMSKLKKPNNITCIAEGEPNKKYFPLVVNRLTMKVKITGSELMF